MEHLTKQQIVLLALLVSFVTSIATGIVAVSLTDQAPNGGVIQTINNIVERTVERVPATDTGTAAAATTIQNPVALAAQKVSKSIVRIKPQGTGTDAVTGIGLIASSEGLILIDKASLTTNPVAALSSGEEYPIQIIQSEILGDNVFAVVLIPKDMKLVPVTVAPVSSSLTLGQTVYSLSGKTTPTLEDGFIKKVPESGATVVETSIPSQSVMLGSPLFNARGEVLGFKTSTYISSSSFASLSNLKSITPGVTR